MGPVRQHQLIRLLAGVVAFDLSVACAALVLQDRWVGHSTTRTVMAAGGTAENGENGILSAGRFTNRRKPTRTSIGGTPATSASATAPTVLNSQGGTPRATGKPFTSSTAAGGTSSTRPRPRPGPGPATGPQATTATTGAATAPTGGSTSTPTSEPDAAAPDAPAGGSDPGPAAQPGGAVTTATTVPAVSRDGWLIINDPAGDTVEDGSGNARTDGRGDILKSAATNKAKGIVLTAQAAQRADPTKDPNWASPSTFVIWELDTNNDGAADYEVQYFVDGGKLVAGVNRAGQTGSDSTCQAEAGYQQESYAVGIEPDCIGAPAAFSYRVTMYYDPDPNNDSEVITDVTPDGGMSPAVKRSAG